MSRSRNLSFIAAGLSRSESLSQEASEVRKQHPLEFDDVKVVQVSVHTNDYQRVPSVEDWDGSKSSGPQTQFATLLQSSLGGESDVACDDSMHDPFRY